MLLALLTMTGAIQGISLQTAATTAQAADPSGFQPGNIIDDSLFFDSGAMSVDQIQTFLNSKVAACASGYVCLKNYTETTHTIAATPMCSQYSGAVNESAAQIIAKVATTCGISPKVILVTLQKEQGLVTRTAPDAYNYRSAMGAGCPDSAACDSNYYGFFNQVHYGAYLLKRYTQPAGTGPGTAYPTRFDLSYPVGAVSNVLYSPNACGSLPVYIQDQATHALYVYTPYTPNSAALAAGYGTGNSCSSYGNRNFYNYFVDWFGSVRGFTVGPAFGDKYQSAGGPTGALGYATGPYTCGIVRGGCYQVFRGGWIVSSANTAPQVLSNASRALWWSLGNENSYLGYPTSDETCGLVNSGCYQTFEGGWMVRSASTPLVDVSLATRSLWWYYGNENGFLEYPTAGQVCGLAGGGCVQRFQGGVVVSSPAGGVRAIWPEVSALWADWGNQGGILGYPTGDPSNVNGVNYTQTFQGGTITVSSRVAAVTSTLDPWFNARVTNPWLGEQTTGRTCGLSGDGCIQQFANGWVLSSTAGAFAIRNEVMRLWIDWGKQDGILGYPSGAATSATGGTYTQAFQGGTVTVTSGVAAVTSTVDPWFNGRVSNPWLGDQTAARKCGLVNGGCIQTFANGWLASSSAGAFGVRTEVVRLWADWGLQDGILGYPTSNPSGTGTIYTQTFQGGTVTVTNGSAALTSVTDPWFNARLENSWLGQPTTSRVCGLVNGGCIQRFGSGWLVLGPAGVFAIRSELVALWSNWGLQDGILGYPSGAASNPAGGTYTQAFQGGTVTVANGSAVVTSVDDPWFNARLVNPWLGEPTASRRCGLVGNGCVQPFTGGVLTLSSAGAVPLHSEVASLWVNWGVQDGILGYPTAGPSVAGSTYTQAFQGGQVTVTNGNAVLTSVTDPWFSARLNSSWLGDPSTPRVCGLVMSGCIQQFTSGWLVLGPRGVFPVRSTAAAFWSAQGREGGTLGYPTSGPSATTGDSYSQSFQGGTIIVTNGIARIR